MSRYLSLIRQHRHERNEIDERSWDEQEDTSLNSFLSSPDTVSTDPVDMQNDEPGMEEALLSGKSILLVACSYLDGEVVCFATDDALLLLDELGLYQGRVVYRVSELEEIRKARPSTEALRIIHEAKQWMGGVYTGLVHYDDMAQ